MCGIIGYVGPRECKHLLLYGLERLEYRGYDSAGIALLEDGGLRYTRAVGNLQNLKLAAGEGDSPATTGLGHTRWATSSPGAAGSSCAPPGRSPSCASSSRPRPTRRLRISVVKSPFSSGRSATISFG